MSTLMERFNTNSVWTIRKWENRSAWERGDTPEVSVINGNMLVNEGINEFLLLAFTTGGTKWDNTNARLIVGTGSGAAQATDVETTFTAGVKKAMDTSYPTVGTQKVTFRSTYSESEANQAWNEFGVLNAATSGKLLNRKVEAEGTKTTGQVWELTLEITFS